MLYIYIELDQKRLLKYLPYEGFALFCFCCFLQKVTFCQQNKILCHRKTWINFNDLNTKLRLNMKIKHALERRKTEPTNHLLGNFIHVTS
jgi:hypothetical protein